MTQPTDLAPVHVQKATTTGSSRSLSRFAPIGLLVMLVALVWGFAATAIDLSFGYSYVVQNWDDVPQIMRSRVPGYSLLPVVAAPLSYGVALLVIYVGGRVWWGEQRWTAAHVLFIIGVTWAAFGLLTLQIDFAGYEIDPEGSSSSVGSLTVAGGWAALITSALLLLRRRKPAHAVADNAAK